MNICKRGLSVCILVSVNELHIRLPVFLGVGMELRLGVAFKGRARDLVTVLHDPGNDCAVGFGKGGVPAPVDRHGAPAGFDYRVGLVLLFDFNEHLDIGGFLVELLIVIPGAV